MKCDDGGRRDGQREHVRRRSLPLPAAAADLVQLAAQLGQLAAHPRDAARHGDDVDQDREPDEAVGDGHERDRRDLLAGLPLDLLELLRQRRGRRGQRDASRASRPERAASRRGVIMRRASSRSSASRRSSASSARAASRRMRSVSSRPHTSVISRNALQNAGRMRGSSVGTTVVLRVNRAPDVDALVDERHVDRREQRQRRRQLAPAPGPP